MIQQNKRKPYRAGTITTQLFKIIHINLAFSIRVHKCMKLCAGWSVWLQQGGVNVYMYYLVEVRQYSL